MILLTRVPPGGDGFFAALLKTMDAICSEQSSVRLEVRPQMTSNEAPQQDFMQRIYKWHLRCQSPDRAEQLSKKPTVNITAPGLEFGTISDLHQAVDTINFRIPTRCVLITATSNCRGMSNANAKIMPLLRILGPEYFLRLLSAALCERRIIFYSKSLSRLSAATYGTVSLLSQGANLTWQHVFVPIVPPHLMNHLAAPCPYIVGVLESQMKDVLNIHGLGEVVTINLDDNGAMNIYNSDRPDTTVPNLLMTQTSTDLYSAQEETTPPAMILFNDLVELVKLDLKMFDTTSKTATVQKNVKQVAAKAKTGFRKFRNKLKNGGGPIVLGEEQIGTGTGEKEDWLTVSEDTNEGNSNVDFDEGVGNERGEEEMKITLISFFVSFIGDPRTYLNNQGGNLIVDRDRYLQKRKMKGDRDGTPMLLMLQNFLGSQMFEVFAYDRIDALTNPQNQLPSFQKLPFTLLCDHMRQNKLDFNSVEIRKLARQAVQSSPHHQMIESSEEIRRHALLVTSKRFEGDAARARVKLTEQCRGCSASLADVMAVLWTRIKDNAGVQWKHAITALNCLRDLLLHGPLTAITEVADGIDKIRLLKSYTEARGPAARDIRNAAFHVYTLLVDRSVLFTQRRSCAERRRILQKTPTKFSKNRQLEQSVRAGLKHFRQIHAALHPTNKTSPSAASPIMGIGQQRRIPNEAPSGDLLSLDFTQQGQTQSAQADVFNMLNLQEASSQVTQSNFTPKPSNEPQPFDIFGVAPIPRTNNLLDQSQQGGSNNVVVHPENPFSSFGTSVPHSSQNATVVPNVANVSLPQQTLQVGNVSQQNYGVQIRQPELNPQGRFNAQYGSNAPVVANVQPPVFSPNSVGYEVTHLPNETGVGVHMGQNQLLRCNTPAYGAQLPYQSHTNIQQGNIIQQQSNATYMQNQTTQQAPSSKPSVSLFDPFAK